MMILSGCSSTETISSCSFIASYRDLDESKGYYKAFIVDMDGEPKQIQPQLSVSTGQHQFRVVELIDAPDLYVPASGRHYHDWQLTIKPNTRYHIAAKYLGNRSQDYWQPIVWFEEPANCETKSKN